MRPPGALSSTAPRLRQIRSGLLPNEHSTRDRRAPLSAQEELVRLAPVTIGCGSEQARLRSFWVSDGRSIVPERTPKPGSTFVRRAEPERARLISRARRKMVDVGRVTARRSRVYAIATQWL